MLVRPESKIFSCKYYVRGMQVIINNTEVYVMRPENIMSLEFFNDYERNMHAMLKVVLRVELRKRMAILKNKSNIMVNLELDKRGFDIEIENPITNFEQVFSLQFIPYFTDDDDSTDVDLTESRIAQNNVLTPSEQTINDENFFETQNAVELYLMNPNLTKASRYLFNRVYTAGYLQDIVASMLKESGHDKVLMSKFENTDWYRELLVPANPVHYNLMFLDQFYGFYRKGMIIFYDIDCLYILNANGRVTAKRRNEWTETNILVPTIAQNVPGQAMMRNPNEKIFYCIVGNTEVKISKGSVLQNASVGSNMKIVFNDTNEILNIKSGTTDKAAANTSLSISRKDSKFTGENMAARLKENEVIIDISAQNLDITAFTPNKTFRVIFDEPKQYTQYKGQYRLAYAYHMIKAVSENYMESTHHIRLKKVD